MPSIQTFDDNHSPESATNARCQDKAGLKHWTLFTMRVMARTCLSLSVLLWLLCQQRQFSSDWMSFDTWSISVTADIEKLTFDLMDAPQLGTVSPMADVRTAMSNWLSSDRLELPGTVCYFYGGASAQLRIHHWLVCLTLLVATVATSIRWGRQPKESLREQTDE